MHRPAFGGATVCDGVAMRRIELTGLVSILGVVIALSASLVMRGCIASTFAQSRPRTAWARTKAQGALIARIVVNENSAMLLPNRTFDPAEVEWFMAVAVNNRPRFKSAHNWLDVIGRLAPHVAMLRPYTRPRQRWTSTLYGCTDAQPRGWVPERDGDWRIYALKWQSFCLDVRDLWISAPTAVNADAMTWGSVDDAKHQLCRPRPKLCPIVAFPGGNIFFGKVGAASCNAALAEDFTEAHCEGRRP